MSKADPIGSVTEMTAEDRLVLVEQILGLLPSSSRSDLTDRAIWWAFQVALRGEGEPVEVARAGVEAHHQAFVKQVEAFFEGERGVT